MDFPTLLWKDLRREIRGKHALAAGLVLVLLFLVLDLFVFPDLRGQVRAATLVLWTPVLYGAVALAGRGLATETDRGTLEWLRSAPVPLLWHGLSRTLTDGLVALLLTGLTLGGAALLFAIPLSWGLALVFLLAVPGLAVVGTLTAGLAAQAQSRDLLLPILAVPVLAPLLLAGVGATLTLLSGGTLADARAPLLLLAGYDLIALGAAWLLWPVVLEGD